MKILHNRQMPEKLCECGCGELAPVATRNHSRYGWVKGQPMRFVKGHAGWKLDTEPSYSAVHQYLRSHFPKAGRCEQCGLEGRTVYALTHGKSYSRDREDYRELCQRCHIIYDGVGHSGSWSPERVTPEAEAPSCRCGCGQLTEWSSKARRWYRFAPGHYTGAARRDVQKGVIGQ